MVIDIGEGMYIRKVFVIMVCIRKCNVIILFGLVGITKEKDGLWSYTYNPDYIPLPFLKCLSCLESSTRGTKLHKLGIGLLLNGMT